MVAHCGHGVDPGQCGHHAAQVRFDHLGRSGHPLGDLPVDHAVAAGVEGQKPHGQAGCAGRVVERRRHGGGLAVAPPVAMVERPGSEPSALRGP